MFLLGAAAELAGVIGWMRCRRWGFFLLALGAGLMLGAAAYILLGLIQPDGAGTGDGSSVVPAP